MSAMFRDLRPEEQAACLDLWAQVFAPSHDYFERYFHDPLWQPRYTRVCEVGGKLVAAMQLVRRPVRIGNGRTVWMAGIANVATLPEYRGRGYASQLLQDLHAVMDSEDFAFGLLFTGIHDFYGRLGWERLPLPLYQATPMPIDISGWRFRVAESDDLPRIQRWYAARYANYPLSVQRDDPYWRIWTRWDDPQWRSKFYIAEDAGGTARGYIALETYHERDENGNRFVSGIGVAELGCDPEDTEAARMLLGFASQTAHMADAGLEIFLPEADIDRLVRPLLPDVRWIGNGGAMVRICCWETIYDALETLSAPAPENLAKLGQAGALALLFGLPAPNGVQIPPDLRERYPLRPACYSPVDSF
ncbi:MAG: GNAT family N-acetyltransferase [Fimbriimonadales bacterium]|nr:GNAT family N-acetyltransferase [Fimbriimonadales bacterium]